MVDDKLTCIVCGRTFYKGQGVEIVFSRGKSVFFHSKSCALKFVKVLLERLEPSVLERSYKIVLEEFEKLLEEKRKAYKKKL